MQLTSWKSKRKTKKNLEEIPFADDEDEFKRKNRR